MPKSLLELTPAQAVARCSPVTREPLSPESAERIAPLVKAIADPVRLRLLSLVASHTDGEAWGVRPQRRLRPVPAHDSHHLKLLHAAGLLDREKRGVWVYYRVNAVALGDLATLLGGVTA